TRAREAALARAEARCERQARHDPLTGLANRAELRSRIAAALAAGAAAGRGTGLCLIDLEHFQELNETRGQEVGDALLCRTAALLRGRLPADHLPARVDGDSFAVLAPEQTGVEAVHGLARELGAALGRPVLLEGTAWASAASIGVAWAAPGEPSATRLIGEAEAALRDVKAHRRGGVGLYSPAIGKPFADRARIAAELRRAAAEGQFVAHFQPQLRLGDGGLLGFEALVRWDHPEKGVLEPCYFLEIAADAGLMEAIDSAMLERALDGLVRMRATGHAVPRVSLNLSAVALRDPGRVDRILWAVDRRDLVPADLAVELLETVRIVGDADPAVACIDRLARLGFGTELDDFGTGYACLANLSRLNVSALKIDRSLVRQMRAGGGEGESQGREIVRAIIALAGRLGVSVLAEGIERAEETALLRELGCGLGQGFAFGRPMPLPAVLDWLAARSPEAPRRASA
ncbi:putative bifunctional diguanylate cyclase/phosphodiesterase, partial [Paralimibaculum aggregatum]|uniref:putative bifunctional diguanylate cyclase/phosphodiesterase n=1 Tax=Paralimibaculum aggregatum TaxID=3036245 RepID=UPI00255643DE